MTSERPVNIEILPESRIDPTLDAKLRVYLSAIFPNWASIFKTCRMWHDAKPVFTVLARTSDGEIAGHVAVVERMITTDWNARSPVASVQGVSVAEPFRKTGLSVKLLDVTLDESRRRGYKHAILYCREPLVHFYERNGWRLSEDSMVMWRDREYPIHMQSNCPMYRELTDEPFPEGPIDVHNPF